MIDFDQIANNLTNQLVVQRIARLGNLNVNLKVSFDNNGTIEQFSVLLLLKGKIMKIRTNNKELLLDLPDQMNLLQLKNQRNVLRNNPILPIAIHLTQQQNILQSYSPLLQISLRLQVTLNQNRYLITNRQTNKIEVLFRYICLHRHTPDLTLLQYLVALPQQQQQVEKLIVPEIMQLSEIFSRSNNEVVQLSSKRFVQNYLLRVQISRIYYLYTTQIGQSGCQTVPTLSLKRTVLHTTDYLRKQNHPLVRIHQEY